MKQRRFAAAAALMALGGAGMAGNAGAQITPSGGGYLFRVRHVRGQTQKVHMRVTSTAAGAPRGGAMQMEIPYTMRTVGVKDRTATVKMTVGPVTVNGRALRAAQTFEVRMDARGRATQINGQPMQRLGIALPEKPLRIGGTFKTGAVVNSAMGQVQASETYTFAGFKNLGGRRAAHLTMAASASGGAASKGSGSVYLAVDDGSLLRMEYSHTAAVKQGERTIRMTQKVLAVRR